MAEVVNTNVFDANKKFIDLAGLDYFWEIAKAHVDEVDAQLSGKITTLETVLGDASNGIVKDVADLRAEVTALGNIEGGQGIGGMIDVKINALDLPNTYDAKGAADAALVDAKDYVDGRFTNEVTGKFDTVGSAAAVQGNLDSHVADAVAHVTADERADWNAAKAAIDTFLKDADMTADAVDTLAELQTYMNNDGAAATQLVNRVAALEAVKDDYKAADTALETSLKGYVDGKDSAMDSRVKVLEGQDVYVKSDVDAAIADAKKAGTDASAALEAYKAVVSQALVDNSSADQAYAKTYTDALFTSFAFAGTADIDGIFSK